MPSAAGRTRCSSARAGSAGRSRCRRHGPTGVSRPGLAGCRPKGSPRSARATRAAGSLIGMPGNGILFCDERAKERDRDRPGGHATRRLLSRRRALAARLGGAEQVLSGSLTEQTRRCGKPGCRCARRRAARPVCLLRPEDRGRGRAQVRPGAAGRGGAPVPAQRRGDRAAARGDLGDQRRAAGPQRTAVAGERRRPGRARAGRGGGGAGQHDHLGAGRRGERRAQDHEQSPGTGGADLPAPVLDGPGPRAHRVDQEPVRAWPTRRPRWAGRAATSR